MMTRPIHPARRLRPLLGVMLSVLGATHLRAQGAAPREAVRSVPNLDLDRYVGRWYEIARLPNRFQARCAGETTAEYARLPDGGLSVTNTCVRADGKLIRATGRARLAKRDGPASRLKVRFAPAILGFLPMVWGDYWVLDLTADYSAALVGTPDRKFLWILARHPFLDEETYRRLVDTAAAQGFAVDSLRRSNPGRSTSPPVSRPAR
jgi:apolipoprotein D and lipocalin family protein